MLLNDGHRGRVRAEIRTWLRAKGKRGTREFDLDFSTFYQLAVPAYASLGVHDCAEGAKRDSATMQWGHRREREYAVGKSREKLTMHVKVPRQIVAIEIRQGAFQISRKIIFLSETGFAPLLTISSALALSEFESEHIRKS